MANAKECDRCGELYKEKTIFSDYIAEYKGLILHRYDAVKEWNRRANNEPND